MALLPSGLPLNHRIDPQQGVSFVIHLDQPIQPDLANLSKIQVQALVGAWTPLPGHWELESNCTSTGTLVRFTPEAMLPRATPLRITLEEGLRDLTGDPSNVSSGALATLSTTGLTTGIGAQGDSVAEGFRIDPLTGQTQEDTNPDFSEVRAIWGPTGLSPAMTPDGVSRARSLWYRLGQGAIQPGAADRAPRFLDFGWDATGVVPVNGTQVIDPTPIASSVALTGLTSQSIVFPKSALASADPAFTNQLQLLKSLWVRLEHGASQTLVERIRVVGVQDFGTQVQLDLSGSCLDTGDCVPLDLMQAFAGPQGVTLGLVPEPYQITTFFESATLPLDTRITITWDATMADANGDPDPSAAFSQTGGWQGNPADLQGPVWDFVRFDVLFELDVSGDGIPAGSLIPLLRGVQLPFSYLP